MNDKLRSVWKEANVGWRLSGRNDESQEIISSRDRWKEGEVFTRVDQMKTLNISF